jgi:ribose-phosphate pyrophosphokinase
VVQSTSYPANDHLMELLIIIDALRRASADRITAVIPYYGYARQDRKHAGRVPITAKLVANMIATAGADRVLCVDLHAEQLQGFFDLPVDHLYAQPVIMDRIRELKIDKPVILAPDAGSMKRTYKYARQLNYPLAMIDKERTDDNTVRAGLIVGDIEGRDAIIIDDMVSTGGSLAQAVSTAHERGAKSVYAYATHPIFSGRALEKLKDLPVGELGYTDTIPVRKMPTGVNIRVISLAPLLAEAIRRTHLNMSISYLMVKKMEELSGIREHLPLFDADEASQ